MRLLTRVAFASCLALAAMLPQAASAQGHPQTRQGFWFNGGIGYGSLGCQDCDGREGALSGNLAIGGTVSQQVLLGAGVNGWPKSENGAELTVATLTAQIGPPRVALPPDEDGVRRHATDPSTLTEALPLGPHRRRLQRALQRRQRRWDEAARRAGLTGALLSEAAFDEAVLDHADGLIATPARTLDAVVIKPTSGTT